MAKDMMDIALEEVLNDNNEEIGEDVVFAAGDFSVIESTAMHQRQLIMNNKGDFKQNPTICVGAPTYIDDEGSQGIVRAIAMEFMKDGMEVKDMKPNTESIADNSVKIFENAYYK